MHSEFIYSVKTWFQCVCDKKIMNQVTNIAYFDRKLFQYRFLTEAIKMHYNLRENVPFRDWVDLINGDRCNLLSKLSFLKPFCPFLRQSRFGTSVYNFTASTFKSFIHIFSHHCRRYPDFVQMFHYSFMMAINGTTTIVNGILSCLDSNARFIRGKSWKIRLFPKSVGKIAKTPILPNRCFKQFLCSSRLASTFG